MLLLLFNGGGGDLSEPIITPPVPGVGVVTQIPAPGGGEWRVSLEIAEPPGSTWYDLTEFYVGDRYQRGGDTYKGDYRAALATVQLQIDSNQAADLAVSPDILAPWGQDTTSLFGANIQLGEGLLIRLSFVREVDDVVVEWLPIWTGRVEHWGDAANARGQIRTHVVQVVDLLSDLANVLTTIPLPAATWDDYFTQLLAEAAWPFGFDLYGDFADAGLPQDLNMVAAINRMDAGTDPLGLVFRTLRTGRLVVHPAPWDTTNTDRYPNPLLDVYPDGLVFSYGPDTGEIEYIADDEQQPFGISRGVSGVLNSFVVTMPDDEIYPVDDPVSIGRRGVRPFSATWILSNPPVVDDLLADRAYAYWEALPLRTTIDHEGFWPALAMLDHLDPVTVIHMSGEDGLVVTGAGVVRNIVEERTVRAAGLINWQSTIQIDLDSGETSEALLPVEDLALVSTESPGAAGPSSAEFSWTNPTQPSITPTEVQYRILGLSLIWVPTPYPGVGADGQVVNWLAAGTQYTIQVRLVRRVDGVVTNFSPVRSLVFTTPFRIFPGPIPDPGDPDGPPTGELPSDPECEDETFELQEKGSDGIWTVTETYELADLTLLDAGPPPTYRPTVTPTYEDDKVYRWVALCDGDVVLIGPEFDPPDSVLDPCTIPPGLSNFPFSDSSLLVYVPKICYPDTISEAVSGIAGVKGDAFGGFGVLTDDPEYRTLIAIGQPEWDDTPGGIVAYGECPQIVGAVEDKSINVRVSVGDDEDCVLFECAAMRITATGVSGQWRPGVTVYKTGSTISVAGASLLDLDTEYTISATHDYSTGDIKLYVDAVEDNAVGGSDNVPTINALPIWRVGAPPDSWITDCAVWDSVIDFPPAPTPTPEVAGWGVDEATSSIDFTAPNEGRGVAAGDIAIVLRGRTLFSNDFPANPAGWTTLATDRTGSNNPVRMYARIMDGTETTVDFGSQGTGSGDKLIWVLVENGTGWESAAVDGDSSAASSDTPASLTASSSGSLFLQLFAQNSSGGGYSFTGASWSAVAGPAQGAIPVAGVGYGAVKFVGLGGSPSLVWNRTSGANPIWGTGGVVITP